MKEKICIPPNMVSNNLSVCLWPTLTPIFGCESCFCKPVFLHKQQGGRALECYIGNILQCTKRNERKPRTHQWRLLVQCNEYKTTGMCKSCPKLVQNLLDYRANFIDGWINGFISYQRIFFLLCYYKSYFVQHFFPS